MIDGGGEQGFCRRTSIKHSVPSHQIINMGINTARTARHQMGLLFGPLSSGCLLLHSTPAPPLHPLLLHSIPCHSVPWLVARPAPYDTVCTCQTYLITRPDPFGEGLCPRRCHPRHGGVSVTGGGHYGPAGPKNKK